MFNTILQSKKFDPSGEYIKKWLPELKNVPVEYIHQPHLTPKIILKKINLNLPDDYPFPIVDHIKQKEIALKEFNKIKGY
jgi:deoxyribodipyrimidine photo-lyase